MSSSGPRRPAKRPRIQKHSSNTNNSSLSHINLSALNLTSASTLTTSGPSNMDSVQPQAAAAAATAYIPGRWRDSGRPVPHDILLHIARYLGDMDDEGDIEARLTLASMMRLSSDGFDAAARTLYRSITVTRDSFSRMFGGNDMKKSKLFDHPVTFPTRESVIRKLGLFQWVKHMHVEELPCEQAVRDLNEAFQVACSQPALGVACQLALGGRLFPRLEGVSFGPKAFLNHHSAPPLGPEAEGGLHRFLTMLRRECAPTHMCLDLPTPTDIGVYKNRNRRAERPRPTATVGAPDPTAAPGAAPVPTVLTTNPHENSLAHAEEATWPAALARAWGIKTLAVHNVRFTRSISRVLLAFTCERLRIFALDCACSFSLRDDGPCGHCDLRWGRAEHVLQSMVRDDDKGEARFKVVEIANVGAGYPLRCQCESEYANAIALLKSYMRSRTQDAEWTLELPHCAKASPCECCGARVAQTGDTGDGTPTINIVGSICLDGHRWEKGFRPELIPGAPAVAAAQGAVAQPAAPAPAWMPGHNWALGAPGAPPAANGLHHAPPWVQQANAILLQHNPLLPLGGPVNAPIHLLATQLMNHLAPAAGQPTVPTQAVAAAMAAGSIPNIVPTAPGPAGFALDDSDDSDDSDDM